MLISDILPAQARNAHPRGKVRCLRTVALDARRAVMLLHEECRLIRQRRVQMIDIIGHGDHTPVLQEANEPPNLAGELRAVGLMAGKTPTATPTGS